MEQEVGRMNDDRFRKMAEAREAAIRLIDSQIEKYLMDVRRFCGVEE